MSVSFYVETNDYDSYYYQCPCGLWKSEVFEDYFKASAARESLKSECKDSECQYDSAHYGLTVCSVYDSIEINLSNTNAAVVLGRLGIHSPDLIGSLEADKFVASCMVAKTTIDTTDYNYVSGRVDQLLRIGLAASAAGRKVLWS
jgi:hypothetical protein